MLSIQQVIKALRKLQNTTHNSELFNNFKQQLAVSAAIKNSNSEQATTTTTLAAAGVESETATTTAAEAIVCESNSTTLAPVTTTNTTTIVTSLQPAHAVTSPNKSLKQQQLQQQQEREVAAEVAAAAINNSSQQQQQPTHDNVCQTTKTTTTTSHHYYSQQHQQLNSLTSHLNECGSTTLKILQNTIATCEATTTKTPTATSPPPLSQEIKINNSYLQQRSQQTQQFYQKQQLHYFHTQHNQSLYSKQKQTKFAMSSLAAEPIALKQLQPQQQDDINTANNNAVDDAHKNKDANASCSDNATTTSSSSPGAAASSNKKPCFNTGFGEIIKFMELIGNLKHTKRTGWVLRDVNDCESISGHMYRMSMMTFLLDGSEGLNQIRCMELALVHDLAESLVGDITPFCGISKVDKRAMEFKAMDDICKLIEPRGKRIMELFEEYEEGNSAESKFVKDLDRLDMVMQAFEYEKRDKCLLKHQEFFDSTEGKFKHPFIKKLVNEIYEQRKELARAEGATPPPYVHVPNMEDNNVAQAHDGSTNGHHCAVAGATATLDPEQQQLRQLNHSDAAAKSTSSSSS